MPAAVMNDSVELTQLVSQLSIFHRFVWAFEGFRPPLEGVIFLFLKGSLNLPPSPEHQYLELMLHHFGHT